MLLYINGRKNFKFMDAQVVILALLLTLFAGLSTALGGLIGLLAKRTNTKFLAAALGFSAGVMIYVSFVEIFKKALNSLIEEMGEKSGSWVCVASFFAGMFFIGLIDRFIPIDKKTKDTLNDNTSRFSLMKTGILMALAVTIHNFPEGLVTFIATLKEPSLGIVIAVAIAIHNIPEGIAVSVPVYYATGNRKKAFVYSLCSGIAEPVGALIGYLIIMNFYSSIVFGVLFAFVGGIMVFIALDQLLPTAKEYSKGHIAIYGLICGMIVMAVSLLLFI